MSRRSSQPLIWTCVALLTLGLHAAALLLIRFPEHEEQEEVEQPTRLDLSILAPAPKAEPIQETVPEASPTPTEPIQKTTSEPEPIPEPISEPKPVVVPPPKPDPAIIKKQQEKIAAEKREKQLRLDRAHALAKKKLEEKRRKEKVTRAAKAKLDAAKYAKTAAARKRAADAKRIASKPSAISQRLPKYPRFAERNGIKGNTTLRITIGSNGRVTSSSIAKSSGHTILDRAALSAVKSWRFKPAKNGLGQPVSYTTTQLIRFQ